MAGYRGVRSPDRRVSRPRSARPVPGPARRRRAAPATLRRARPRRARAGRPGRRTAAAGAARTRRPRRRPSPGRAHTVPRRDRGQRGGHRGAEVDPQRQPTGGHARPPRQGRVHRGEQSVAAHPQLGPAVRQQRRRRPRAARGARAARAGRCSGPGAPCACPSRSTTSRCARTQPRRRPPQKLFEADPTAMRCSSGAVPRNGGGGSPSSVRSESVSSPTTGVRYRVARCRSRARASTGSDVPVGFWWSGVTCTMRGEAWRSVASSRSRSTPSGVTGTATGLGPGGPDGGERVGVGGVLDGDPVAGTDEGGQQQARRGLGPGRDEDLLGRGRHAAPRVALGEVGTQLGQAQVGVPPGGHVGREPVERASRGVGEGGRRLGCRDGQVHRAGRAGVRHQHARGGVGTSRQGRDAARAAAGTQHALLAEPLVGGRGRGPGQAERAGELPLAGHPGADRQATVQDGAPDGVGEPPVRRHSGGQRSDDPAQSGGGDPAFDGHQGPFEVRPLQGQMVRAWDSATGHSLPEWHCCRPGAGSSLVAGGRAPAGRGGEGGPGLLRPGGAGRRRCGVSGRELAPGYLGLGQAQPAQLVGTHQAERRSPCWTLSSPNAAMSPLFSRRARINSTIAASTHRYRTAVVMTR